MQKVKSLLLIFLLVVMIATPYFSGVVIAHASSPIANTGANIVVAGMPNEGTIGEVVNIPAGSSTDGTVDAVIYDPRGSVVFDSTVDVAGNSYVTINGSVYEFTTSLPGEYKVVYAVVSADENVLATTTTPEFKILISGTNPYFDFGTNSKVFLPQTTNYDYQITLPNPVVYDKDGEEVASPSITVTVTKPDAVTTITTTTVDVDGINHEAFTPLLADGEGVYTVTYQYQDSNGLSAVQTFEIEVDSDFDAEAIELDYNLEGSMPNTAVQNNEVTLPQVVTRDSANSNALLNTYVEIKVEWVNPDGENVLKTVEDFKFTPDVVGDYIVTYTVYDFVGVVTDTSIAEYVYQIENVTDSQAPEVEFVDAYLVADENNEAYDFVNYEVNVPSVVATGSEVYLPAIHAFDNVSVNNLAAGTGIGYERNIVNPNGIQEDLDHLTTNAYGFNELVPYTFSEAGNYTLKYVAIDEAGRRREISLLVKSVEGHLDNEAPRITLETLPVYVENDEVITFNNPVVVDYESAESTDTVDTRVDVKVYYYLGDDDTNKTLIEENEDGQLEFTVPSSVPAGYLHVLVEAVDDGPNNSAGVNTATKTVQINVMDTNDVVAPSRALDHPTFVAVDQDDTVSVPTVKFTDNNPTFLSVDMYVVDPNGQEVAVNGLQMEYELDTLALNDADGILVSGANFVAALAGNYRIVYVVKDVAGNTFVQSYTQFVNDTRAPSFQIDGVPVNIEVGETFTLPVPTIMDNGVEIANEALTTVKFLDSPSYNFVFASNKFTALEEGTYTFKYLAEDAEGNTSESSVYTMTASDTVAPVLTIDANRIFPVTAPLTRANENDPYDVVIVNAFTATDALNGIEEYFVTVEGPNNETILDARGLEGLSENGNYYEFVPTRAGTYKVTYTAIDLAGNETEEVKLIKVGDSAAPVITVGNTAVNVPTNAMVNDTLTLDMTAITIADNEDGTIDLDELTSTGESKFSVILKGPNGSEVAEKSGTDYAYDLEDAGTYSIIFTARDEAGNEEVETINFSVSVDTVDPTIVTETWGIILIVLSVLVLGGVVIYFARSRQLIEE